MEYKKPLPLVNADNRPFWQGCREHVLKIQKCSSCGQLRYPPSFLCPECHSKENKWISVPGKGRVYTFAVYHTAFHPGFDEDLPYVVAVVELDEGPRLISNIKDCPPEEVFCGMRVEVTWTDATEEFSIPGFTPSQEN